MTMRWLRTGRSARGVPGQRRPLRHRALGFVLLALVGLTQTGCQSGFFSPCGASPCGSVGGGPCNYLKGLRERVFSRRVTPMTVGVVGGGSCCGGEAPMAGAAEAPLEMGPPTMVAPGTVPSLPSAPSDMGTPPPTDLSPAPIERTPSATPEPATGQANPSGASGKTSSGRTSYEAARPRNRYAVRDGASVARTVASTPASASRPAQGGAAPASDHWLENLPPLSIPRDDSHNELPEPAPPAEEVGARLVSPTPADVRADGVAGKEGSDPEPAPAPPAEISAAPGLRRFVALAPKLSGGSLPTTTGLDWLAEKGYKTILDLREASQVQPAFIEEVANRGMRYVALPIGLKKLDAEHVDRFNLEISLIDNRPLYFCDTDGVCAGALWYIRRVTVDGVDAQAADREATELGLNDPEFRKAATAYASTVKTSEPNPPAPDRPADTKVPAEKPTPDPAPAQVQPQPSALAPASTTPTAAAAPQEAKPAKAPATSASEPAPVPSTLPGGIAIPLHGLDNLASQVPAEPANGLDPRDTTIWRSCAALVVTGLGVPLAYWGRTSLPSLRGLVRASLPAPAPKSKALPPASDE